MLIGRQGGARDALNRADAETVAWVTHDRVLRFTKPVTARAQAGGDGQYQRGDRAL